MFNSIHARLLSLASFIYEFELTFWVWVKFKIFDHFFNLKKKNWKNGGGEKTYISGRWRRAEPCEGQKCNYQAEKVEVYASAKPSQRSSEVRSRQTRQQFRWTNTSTLSGYKQRILNQRISSSSSPADLTANSVAFHPNSDYSDRIHKFVDDLPMLCPNRNSGSDYRRPSSIRRRCSSQFLTNLPSDSSALLIPKTEIN